MKRRIIFPLSFTVLFLLSACGDGDFRVNPTAGVQSSVSGTGNVNPRTAQEFFEYRLFQLMTANGGTRSCIGCHPPSTSRPKYFQLNATSVPTSYLYMEARKSQVVQGDYADTQSSTIQKKKDQNHQSFSAWSSEEKALIDQWTNFTP